MEKINYTRFFKQLLNKFKGNYHELGGGLRIEESGETGGNNPKTKFNSN